MLTEKEVNGIYRGLLGRNPETKEAVQNQIKRHKSIGSMIRVLTNSKEFRYSFFKKNIPEKVLVYIHTPKTAGTYLRRAWLLNNIKNYFWSDEYKVAVRVKKIKKLQQDYVEASYYEMIGGHFPINVFLEMKTIQPRIFLNVLRDPVSRILSFYNYVQNKDKQHPFYDQATKHTLCELLEQKGAFYEAVNNQQIRFLIAEKELLNRFSDRDMLIVGKQEKIDEFITKVNDIVGFKVGARDAVFNVGDEGYIEKLKTEPDFDKALGLLEEITVDERELFDSIDDVMVMNKVKYTEFVSRFGRESDSVKKQSANSGQE